MRKTVISSVAAVVISISTVIAAPVDVELWRLDCGEFRDFNIDQMSDTFAFPGRTKTLANSCYLIRHNSDYMLWDTGFSTATIKDFNVGGMNVVMRETLVDQLSRIKVDRKQISIIGISHFHPDHTGQAPQFPRARLLMGKPDFEMLADTKSPDITPWLTKRAHVEKVSGDLWHISEQVSHNGVPPENVDRAATLASMDRILKAAANLKANIIIQREKSDIIKLPLFPASAK